MESILDSFLSKITSKRPRGFENRLGERIWFANTYGRLNLSFPTPNPP